jgi:hypothetical protein
VEHCELFNHCCVSLEQKVALLSSSFLNIRYPTDVDTKGLIS